MDVKVLSSKVLPQRKSKENITEIPLTIFDRLASNMHIAVLYAFRPPTATNFALVEGLSKTLEHFPTLGGCLGKNLQNRASFLLGEHGCGGVLVVEAEVASNLEDHLPMEPSNDLARLHPSTETTHHLLQVQLNRFTCGGLVIGVTAHHRVADGQSMSSFFIAWGKSVRGLQVDPIPIYDQDWVQPRIPPKCDFDHWGIEFCPTSLLPSSPLLIQTQAESVNIVNILVEYSDEFIKTKLKAGAPPKLSRFDVLMGHLWRKLTKARGLNPDVITQVRVAVNGRPRLSPPVPSNYFGNLVLNAFARAKVQDLLEGSVANSAQLVHDSVRRVDNGYIRSFIDFGETIKDVEMLVAVADLEGSILCPNLEIDCWLGFQFNEVNFGRGGLCGFLPSWVGVEGVVILMPTLQGYQKGGVQVVVTLLEEHARLFREISHSLD